MTPAEGSGGLVADGGLLFDGTDLSITGSQVEIKFGTNNSAAISASRDGTQDKVEIIAGTRHLMSAINGGGTAEVVFNDKSLAVDLELKVIMIKMQFL